MGWNVQASFIEDRHTTSKGTHFGKPKLRENDPQRPGGSFFVRPEGEEANASAGNRPGSQHGQCVHIQVHQNVRRQFRAGQDIGENPGDGNRRAGPDDDLIPVLIF